MRPSCSQPSRRAAYIIMAVLAGIMVAATPDSAGARKVRLSLQAPKAGKSNTLSQPRAERVDSLLLSRYADSISFAGFDKTAPSTKETFYIVNHSPWHLCRLRIRLTYRDMSGRMLHRREETIATDLPPGETRMAAIRAFDIQKSLYYHKSRPPRSGGMPFIVEIELLEAARPL